MNNWNGEQDVHYARPRHGRRSTPTECGLVLLPTSNVHWASLWTDVACSGCLAVRAKRGRRITWAMAVVATLIVGAVAIGAVIADYDDEDDEDEANLGLREVHQTIVAEGIQGTISAIELTRTYPTRQIEAATKAVENTRAAHAAIENRTRAARQSATATKNAPAPYSVRVQGMDVICREIAYEYVYMADLGKVTALQHVATMIYLRDPSGTRIISAHDAENALAECKCFSPRNCKPLQ